jgi:predicted ATPase
MDGTPLKIGKRDFVVPEASLEVAEQATEKTEQLDLAKNNAQAFATIAEVVRICLLENYPELTLQEVKRAIPFRSAVDCMVAVLVAAGLRQTQGTAAPGEAVSP